LSVHSIRNLNSTPPFCFYPRNDFSDPTTWLPWLMGTFKGNSVDIRSNHPEKHSVTLVKNEYFLRGCGPCFFASCVHLWLCDQQDEVSKRGAFGHDRDEYPCRFGRCSAVERWKSKLRGAVRMSRRVHWTFLWGEARNPLKGKLILTFANCFLWILELRARLREASRRLLAGRLSSGTRADLSTWILRKPCRWHSLQDLSLPRNIAL